MVGQPLPPLALDYLRDKPDFSGKPMILEFWATWCPPCRKSIPHLNEIFNKYKDQGLVVIGVTSEEKSVVSTFLAETKMEYSPAIDAGGKLSEAFGITGIPHAFLVNKEGKIVWEGHPMALKESDLEGILK